MRMIDADALGIGKCNPDVFENKGYASGWNAAIDLINAAPTIDVVPVVRCGECVHNYLNWRHDKLDITDYTDITCDYWMSDGLTARDFCSYGERREDGAI